MADDKENQSVSRSFLDRIARLVGSSPSKGEAPIVAALETVEGSGEERLAGSTTIRELVLGNECSAALRMAALYNPLLVHFTLEEALDDLEAFGERLIKNSKLGSEGTDELLRLIRNVALTKTREKLASDVLPAESYQPNASIAALEYEAVPDIDSGFSIDEAVHEPIISNNYGSPDKGLCDQSEERVISENELETVEGPSEERLAGSTTIRELVLGNECSAALRMAALYNPLLVHFTLEEALDDLEAFGERLIKNSKLGSEGTDELLRLIRNVALTKTREKLASDVLPAFLLTIFFAID